MKNIVTKIVNEENEEIYVKKDINLLSSVAPLLFNQEDFTTNDEGLEIPVPEALENLMENYNIITSFSQKNVEHYDDKTKEIIKDIVKGLKEWQEQLNKCGEMDFVVFNGETKHFSFNPIEAKRKFLGVLLVGKLNYSGLTLTKHIQYYELVKQLETSLIDMEGVEEVSVPTVGENLLLLVGQKEVFRTRLSVKFKEESFERAMIESELHGFAFSKIKDFLTTLGYHTSFIKIDFDNDLSVIVEVIKS